MGSILYAGVPHLHSLEICCDQEAGKHHSLRLCPNFVIWSFALSGSVSAINDDVSASSVRASIAGKIDVSPLQLGRLGITAHGNHAVPEILSFLVDEVGETGVDVAGRDGVDPCEVTPFVGKGASKVDAAGFGDVVGGLKVLLAVTVGM